ncbi:helix-turn-helix transcriptional regulator [Weissella confusa]|uniref:helix-turn-helix transcriptional regulator n=1 Tax=Weissella confusa TaxID=1583 RepID=UPI00237C242D|nr:helix-turn-helix transcriptional regulator [Weissella confusa]
MYMENRVKAVRVATGMSQKELAATVGVTRQTLSLIEKGAYNPTLKLAVGIAKALDTTLDALFWTEG